MTDDTAQSTPAPTESTPSPEVATPAAVEPTLPSPEPASVPEPAAPTVSPESTPTPAELVPVVEHATPTETTSVIPEESQSAQEIPGDSRSMSQPSAMSQVSQPKGRKWSTADRAKSAATKARKKDVYLAEIVAHAKLHGGKITNDEIEKLLHVSDATAARYAKILVGRGLFKGEGKGRGALYVVL